MYKGRLIVAGIGPGDRSSMTTEVINAVATAEVIVSYKYYIQFIEKIKNPDALIVDTGMKKERERAEEAFNFAELGKQVCIISSGDAGIYGMASLILEIKERRHSELDVEILPGISAFQKAAALLGAPMGHDFCVLSMSDLLTPWPLIEKRIIAAADADLITAIYNPMSQGRYWQLHRLKELFLQYRSPETPVGYVRQAGREDEQVKKTTLKEFDPNDTDMFTIVIIGNSQTYFYDRFMVTPRGYFRKEEDEQVKIGQEIMINSFKTISGELKNPNIPLDRKWALLHAIHTTADFDMENLLLTDDGAVEKLHRMVKTNQITTIITDVSMVVSGIRKGALKRLGIEAQCYLSDPRTRDLADKHGITRTQAGIRLAVEEHPTALFAFGNAPTALMELCQLIRKGVAKPAGVIAAPVGFVNVRESKQMIKPFYEIPKIIVEGRKGGSNLAATLVNAILTLDDAADLKPGRDV